MLVRIYPPDDSPALGRWSGAATSSDERFLPSSPGETWYAELYMQVGELQYASVYSPSGERRLVGQEALTFLGQIGGLSYELLPIPAQPAPPPPPPGHVTGPHPSRPFGYVDPSPPPPEPPFPPRSPSASSWLPPRAPPPPAAWRPVRTRWGENVVQNAQQLSRDERRVLSLINGQRTIDELSRLLGFSAESLAELIAYFRDQNLIT